MTIMASTVKRPYRSPLRAAQAANTRLAVIEAAARLFTERGYVATSIDAIAQAAGVGRATVFTSVGGKAALLKAAYDVAIVGDDEPVALPERPWARRVRVEPDPRRMLALYAEMVTSVSDRVAGLYEAMRGAASADREVSALWEAIQEERRGGAANFVGFLTVRGRLKEGLEETAAADLVWVLIDPVLSHLLVHRRGWSPARFAGWLAATMESQLLPPPSPSE